MPFFHGLVSTSNVSFADAEGLKSKNRSRTDGWRQFSAVFDTRSDRSQILHVMPRKQAVYCRVFHREKWGRVRSPREQRHLMSQRKKGLRGVRPCSPSWPLWKVVRRFNKRPASVFWRIHQKYSSNWIKQNFVLSSYWLIWNRVLARIS